MDEPIRLIGNNETESAFEGSQDRMTLLEITPTICAFRKTATFYRFENRPFQPT